MRQTYYVIPDYNDKLRVWREGDAGDCFDVIKKEELLTHMEQTSGMYIFGDPEE